MRFHAAYPEVKPFSILGRIGGDATEGTACV